MLRNVEQWYKCAMERGTSGDMVFDILKDWRENLQLLSDKPYITQDELTRKITRALTKSGVSEHEFNIISKIYTALETISDDTKEVLEESHSDEAEYEVQTLYAIYHELEKTIVLVEEILWKDLIK